MASSPGRSAPTSRSVTGLACATAPCPVLVVDPEGTLSLVNHAAAALFPGARIGAELSAAVPRWITTAHRQFKTGGPLPASAAPPAPADGAVGDRSFAAHPTPLDHGDVAWWFIDDTERRAAAEALAVERGRTRFLSLASNALLSSLNVDRCMAVTAQLAAEHLADGALVIGPVSGRTHDAVSCARGAEPRAARLTVDPSELPGLAEALQGFPPLPSRWVDPALAPSWVVPEGFGTVGSMVVTPLPGPGVAAGALVLLRHGDTAAFDDNEEVFARLFAARAGAAMSAARLYAEQTSITETLMRDLLPPALHHIDGIEFAGGYRPSGDDHRIGGDFYDVHRAPPPGAGADADEAGGGETLVVLGDVCGKGLDAAVLTGKIRNTLQALLPMASDHRRMLRLLNGALLNSHHARFATLVLASAARHDGKVTLRLTSAGHPPPLIVRGDGTVEEVPTRGTLVGALPEVEAVTLSAELAPGETCVLFTDGFTEAKGGPLGGELFGETRMKRALSACAGMPAEAIVERMQMMAAQWIGGGRHDDMALVAITAPRTNHLSAVGGHGPGRYTA
ncbi:PP2C family protein-serine/threonine phosphatase [Streptomyces sp. NPDC029003]|uniref:PP2C family protein-serine/threonine phosphatase n=1 Tax=Streptomyces sp. NPDC029003 TaxID=3155125 RepID=UPI0033D93470